MIKIAVAVYDTLDNKRTEYTKATYESLKQTINPKTTEVWFVDNDSCSKTKRFLRDIEDQTFHVITNRENIGTAEAINKVIKLRQEGDYIIKLDNDVTFGQYGWADRMKACIEKDHTIGVLGLKRKDLPNSPTHEHYTTELMFLPHEEGDSWHIVEVCGDIIGTCLMINPDLLDKIGYLYQPGIYGFDDVLLCTRSIIAGFRNAFYPAIEIEHIDTAATPYTEWKKNYAGIYLPKLKSIEKEYWNNPKSIYYEPENL